MSTNDCLMGSQHDVRRRTEDGCLCVDEVHFGVKILILTIINNKWWHGILEVFVIMSHGALDQVTEAKMFCILKWVNFNSTLQPAQYLGLFGCHLVSRVHKICLLWFNLWINSENTIIYLIRLIITWRLIAHFETNGTAFTSCHHFGNTDNKGLM